MEKPKGKFDEPIHDTSIEEYYLAHLEQGFPRKFLVESIRYVEGRENALDIGAGVLKETKYLIDQGFKHVTALDRNVGVKKYAQDLPQDKVELVLGFIQKYEFPVEKFDLVIAHFSLHVMFVDMFYRVFADIKKSLKPGGVFVGQLLGSEDDWSKQKYLKRTAFLTKDETEEILADMEIITLNEIKYEGGFGGTDEVKQWHQFNVVARKPKD